MQDVAAPNPPGRKMSGWQPNFLATPEQLHNQQIELLARVGRRLTAGWTGWDPTRGRWHPRLPVVLVFDDGVQLELAWQIGAIDKLSVTWNTIDLNAPPDQQYEWRSSQPTPLAAIAGHTLTGFATVETPYFRYDDLDDTARSDFDAGRPLPMHTVAGWDVSGLWIEFGERGLLVYCTADGTFLSAEPVYPGPETATRSTPWPPPAQETPNTHPR